MKILTTLLLLTLSLFCEAQQRDSAKTFSIDTVSSIIGTGSIYFTGGTYSTVFKKTKHKPIIYDKNYHIRVECIDGKYTLGAKYNYQIRYTFDNWKTSHLFPAEWTSISDDEPFYQPYQYETREEAIETSKIFRSPADLKRHVDFVYQTYKSDLKKYWKDKLKKESKQKLLAKKCCTVIQVY